MDQYFAVSSMSFSLNIIKHRTGIFKSKIVLDEYDFMSDFHHCGGCIACTEAISNGNSSGTVSANLSLQK
jgi:hypothetical protein